MAHRFCSGSAEKNDSSFRLTVDSLKRIRGMSSPARSSERTLRSLALFLLFVSGCEKPVNPFGPPLYYVSTVSGLSVRESPGLNGKLIDLLPYNKEVQILERSDLSLEIGYLSGHWVKIQYASDEDEKSIKQGWVFDGYLSDRPIERYFLVSAIDGLELRQRPDLQAGIIARLPNGTTGLIETAGRRIDTIGGRRGFWFRTTFDEVKGWAFSGAVVLAGRRYDLEARNKLGVDDRELEESDIRLDKISRSALSVKVHDLKDFRVHAVRFHLREHEICDRQESILVFERKRDGQRFTTSGFSSRIEKENYPLNGALLIRSRDCACCASEDRLQVIFPDRAGPRMINFYKENLEARCEVDPPMQRIVFRSENRIDPESGDLFLFWQEPDCGFEVDQQTAKEKQKSRIRSKTIRVVQDFRHSIFARIRFKEGRLRIDRYQDRSIPPSLRDAWERSDPL
jgi:hypothetical protein